MISKDGHLTFIPANNKDIYFDTSGTGRVKVGNEDLTEQLKQVRPWKSDQILVLGLD